MIDLNKLRDGISLLENAEAGSAHEALRDAARAYLLAASEKSEVDAAAEAMLDTLRTYDSVNGLDETVSDGLRAAALWRKANAIRSITDPQARQEAAGAASEAARRS